MTQAPVPVPRPGIAQLQHTALLRTTLARITRYAEQMRADLDAGEMNLAHADQLGHSVLTVMREAASIAARAEHAARLPRPA